MTPTTIRIPDELLRDLDKHCRARAARTGEPVNASRVIREALRFYLAIDGKAWLQGALEELRLRRTTDPVNPHVRDAMLALEMVVDDG